MFPVLLRAIALVKSLILAAILLDLNKIFISPSIDNSSLLSSAFGILRLESQMRLRAAEPPYELTVHFGSWVLLKFLRWPCFSKCIDLASKVSCIAMIYYSLLYGNWDISNCLSYFISTKLKHHICVFENMGVVETMSHPKYGRGCT